jgi:hypothetical protein
VSQQDAYSGTRWQVVITTSNIISLKNLGHIEGPRWLNGRTADGLADLAPSNDYTGTKWEVVVAGNNAIALKCLGNIEGPRWLNGNTVEGSLDLVPQWGAQSYSGTLWEIQFLH